MVSRRLQIAGIKAYIYSIHRLKKRIIERAIEYVEDRAEGFDDYYPYRKSLVVDDSNIVHVYQWMTMFIFLHTLFKSQPKTNILKFLTRKGEKIPYLNTTGWDNNIKLSNCN